ncbi:MAG: T9SS type B sorting domain-containing protein [Chitinophagaceae bacterium]|nr:T9SS type B sorting domain-containing protein [Chitinophagaceae bacterium]
MKIFSIKYWGLALLLLCFNNSTIKAQVGLCPSNLDFELGDFTGWEARWGSGTNALPLPNIGIVAGRHTIISAATAGLDPYGGFPTICPNGSNYSVKLGNNQTGNQAESISYTYTIPAGLTSFSMLFHYAVVFQDPNHTPAAQPRFRARIIDVATGLPLNCVNFDFIASANLPGFQPSPIGGGVWYKDWTPVSINLSAYIGSTIRLEFVTNDCTQGGHFGYAYLDVNTNCSGVISGNFICPGDTAITLTAPFGFQGYEWYSDATFTSTLSTTQTLYVNPLPAVGTIYPIVVTPYVGFGCRDTLYAVIDVGATPAADAGPDQIICNNQAVQIGTLPNPAYSYAWTPAGQVSPSATIANPFASVVTPTPVEFIVDVTDIVTGCKAQDTTYISAVFVDTAMAVNGQTTYCTGSASPGILSVNNTLVAVQWYDGLTPIPGATGFAYQPTASGNYWAQVQQGGCTDSTRTVSFNIGITPTSVAGPDANICANQSIQIGGPPNAAHSYAWAPASQVSNATISDPQAWVNDGTPVQFIVRTTDIASGCYSQDTMYITGRLVDTSLSVTGKTLYCTGDANPGVLSVSNALVGVQWYNGAIPIPGATGFIYQPIVSGNYWAEVQQNGCTDSSRTVSFTINTTPVSNAGPDGNICANATIQIGAPSAPGLNYSWTPAAQVSNPAIADPQAWVNDGTPLQFIVRTTDPATGCYSQDTTYVTGRVVDTALFVSGKTGYCVGDPAAGSLSVNPGHTAVQWYNGAAPLPGATANTFTPTVTGNYWALLQQFGCSDSTITTAFAIHAMPVVGFTPSSDTGCVTRNSFLFTNNSSNPEGAAMTYLWRFSDGSTQTLTDAVRTFMTVGNYAVKLITTTEFGCADSTGLTTVHVLPNGVADFRWDSICVNRPSLFHNLSDEKGSTQVNYSWNLNNGGPILNVKDPGMVTYNTPGVVDVTLTLTALGCENDPNIIVKKVQCNVSKSGTRYTTITVPEGAKRFIHARDSIGQNFQWQPMVQLSNYHARYSEFTAVNDVLYQIFISDKHTCVTVDTLQMLVLKKPGYYLPTAFTPNGDGLNDIARPYLVGMKSLVSFSVFNRWGNRIFYSQQEGKGWDGRFNGNPQASGVYVWILEFLDNSNKKVTEKGTITLIR